MSKDLYSKITDALRVIGVIGLYVLIFFGAQILAITLLVIGLRAAGFDADRSTRLLEDSALMQLLLVFLVAAVSVATAWSVIKLQGLAPKKFLRLDKLPTAKNLAEVLAAWVVFFAVMIITSWLLDGLTPVDVQQAQDLGIRQPQNLSSIFVTFLLLVVMPPVHEEIMFRGFLFHSLRRYSSVIVAAVLTCVLFGMAHLEYSNLNWIAAIDTAIFSAFLIYISQRHKSLYSAMALHMLKNSVAFAIFVIR